MNWCSNFARTSLELRSNFARTSLELCSNFARSSLVTCSTFLSVLVHFPMMNVFSFTICLQLEFSSRMDAVRDWDEGVLVYFGNVSAQFRLKLLPSRCAVKREIWIYQDGDIMPGPWTNALRDHVSMQPLELNDCPPQISGVALVKPCFKYNPCQFLSVEEKLQYHYWMFRAQAVDNWQADLSFWKIIEFHKLNRFVSCN